MKHLIPLLVLLGAGAGVACQNTEERYEVMDDAQSVSLDISGMT